MLCELLCYRNMKIKYTEHKEKDSAQIPHCKYLCQLSSRLLFLEKALSRVRKKALILSENLKLQRVFHQFLHGRHPIFKQ